MLISTAVLQVASAERWEPTTHECSLVFPDGSWSFQQGNGKEVDHGQIILSATYQDRTKAINVIRYRVDPSISVKDPRFVNGIKNGFAKSGSGCRIVMSGYANVNGHIAYWFTGEGLANGRKISTLRYALCEQGRLYQLDAESLGSSALNDDELHSILSSFQMHTEAWPSAPVSDKNPLAYRIGQATGYLLVFILVAGIISKQIRKRACVSKSLPPLVAAPPSKTTTFAQQAATGSWVSGVVICVIIVLGGRSDARVVVEFVALLLMVVGFALGIAGLFGIRKHGRKGILAPAIVGIVINALLLSIFVTNFLAARTRARGHTNRAAWSPVAMNSDARDGSF